MAINNPFEKLTDSVSVEAAADLDAVQHHFVKYDGSFNTIICSVLGEKSIGVLQNDPPAGESAVIGTGGYTRVIASAAIARFDDITTAANGRAVTTVTSTHRVRGQAITTASANGDVLTILLKDFVLP